MKEFEVTITSSGKRFRVREGENVLAAALRQGVMLPYSCKNGTCGSCKGLLERGTVHYPFHPPLALEDEEMAGGYALLCQAEPLEDLEVQVREIEAVRDIQVRMLPARVLEKDRLSDNVVRLRLRLPASQRLQFLAGQYVDVLLAGGKRRAFSIASCPSLENEIELHIRHVEGGDFTSFVFDDLKERDILRFEGPLGNFFIRNDEPDRPMILMGGGTGFAPLKSMIENLLEHNDRREIHLYWGARTAAELYLDDLPRRWARKYPHIHYRRALSDEPAGAGVDSGEPAFRGFVHDAVVADHADLSGFDVYMSGPPAMIEAAKKAFARHGLPADRLFYDSFEFGLDVPVRVLTQPH
ncbi:MAG: CDP-6-deoxy-delta-3,4-glucoseen reductase [Xanthomonadales bacterium]|nr:CDP-6-deoxy-delta-3,4-glucoseen reductase [Xanthomonadales bacterium]